MVLTFQQRGQTQMGSILSCDNDQGERENGLTFTIMGLKQKKPLIKQNFNRCLNKWREGVIYTSKAYELQIKKIHCLSQQVILGGQKKKGVAYGIRVASTPCKARIIFEWNELVWNYFSCMRCKEKCPHLQQNKVIFILAEDL